MISTIKCQFCGWRSPAFKKNKKSGKMLHQYYKLAEHMIHAHENEYEKIQEFCSNFFLEEEEEE